MTKTIEERLEEQEEVLQLMLTKLQTLENRKVEFPDIRIPNYSSQLEILKKELLRVNHSYPVEKIEAERLATERAEIAAREKVQSAKQRLRELRQLQGKLKVNN